MDDQAEVRAFLGGGPLEHLQVAVGVAEGHHRAAADTKASWTYIGCSVQSVPSLSKVAMRSAAGTKSGAPSFVTRVTKSSRAFFAGPSFQDGSGSAGACPAPVCGLVSPNNAAGTAASTARRSDERVTRHVVTSS